MIKEISAGIILISLVLLGFLNFEYIENFTSETENYIDKAELGYKISNNNEDALKNIKSAYKIWNSQKNYCKSMLRYDDIESVNDAFFEVLNALEDGNFQITQLEILRSKLENLISNEKLTLNSIF